MKSLLKMGATPKVLATSRLLIAPFKIEGIGDEKESTAYIRGGCLLTAIQHTNDFYYPVGNGLGKGGANQQALATLRWEF